MAGVLNDWHEPPRRARVAPAWGAAGERLPLGDCAHSRAWSGTGSAADALAVARPLHARTDERREILRQTRWARGGNDRGHGERSFEFEPPRFRPRRHRA